MIKEKKKSDVHIKTKGGNRYTYQYFYSTLCTGDKILKIIVYLFDQFKIIKV